jgi:phosphoglycolate phosphatase
MADYKSILFDFDYTLADSSRGVVECVNTALLEMGHKSADIEAIRCTIGLPIKDAFGVLTGLQNEVAAREFSDRFIAQADRIMVDKTTIYPGVTEIMRFLRSQGFRLGIVSTKYRRRITAVLRRENLDCLFEQVIGGEDVSEHKPAPESLLLATARLQLSIKEVVYVGDSTVDAEAAERAEATFIAVTTGMTPAKAFQRYMPSAVISSLRELPLLMCNKQLFPY